MDFHKTCGGLWPCAGSWPCALISTKTVDRCTPGEHSHGEGLLSIPRPAPPRGGPAAVGRLHCLQVFSISSRFSFRVLPSILRRNSERLHGELLAEPISHRKPSPSFLLPCSLLPRRGARHAALRTPTDFHECGPYTGALLPLLSEDSHVFSEFQHIWGKEPSPSG